MTPIQNLTHITYECLLFTLLIDLFFNGLPPFVGYLKPKYIFGILRITLFSFVNAIVICYFLRITRIFHDTTPTIEPIAEVRKLIHIYRKSTLRVGEYNQPDLNSKLALRFFNQSRFPLNHPHIHEHITENTLRFSVLSY